MPTHSYATITDDTYNQSLGLEEKEEGERQEEKYTEHPLALLEGSEKTFPIRKVLFRGLPSEQQASFPALRTLDWESIPPLCIITGQNGVGKSQLLNYIAGTIRTQERFKMLKIDSDEVITGSFDRNVGVTNASEDASQFKPATNSNRNHVEKNSLSVVGSVFQAFHDHKIKMMEEYGKASNNSELFDFYCQKEDLNKDSIESYKSFIDLNKEGLEGLVETYANSKVGKSPQVEFNEMLERNNFTYRANFDPEGRGNENKLTFTRLGSHKKVDPKQMSSGEQTILNMFAWQYSGQEYGVQDGLAGDRPIQKVDIMILDEPDRHLDPRFNKTFLKILDEEFVKKQGIQVIMTTHRFDTVSLAPQNSVFTMQEKDGVKSVSPSHKTLSQLRLAKNVREFSVPIKVYTESFNDAEFYERIHDFLLQKRDEGVNFGRGPVEGGKESWPSRRYIPKFHTSWACPKSILPNLLILRLPTCQ